MTKNEFAKLERGDIVRSIGGHNSYVIHDRIDNRTLVAVRTITVTNPDEWEIAIKARRINARRR
jgi:hypothetical protein